MRVIDNRTRSGSIRLSGGRDGRILNCEVRNYMTIAIDDRTQNLALLGYAFRCIDGTAIVCDRCRGTLIQGNRIVEENLRPTPEIKRAAPIGQVHQEEPDEWITDLAPIPRGFESQTNFSDCRMVSRADT